MTKADLAEALYAAGHITRSQAETIVDWFFDELATALRRNDAITIRGFGTFSTKTMPAREGRNPKTMEPVHIPAKVKAHFKASKGLTESLNTVPASQVLRAGPPTRRRSVA